MIEQFANCCAFVFSCVASHLNDYGESTPHRLQRRLTRRRHIPRVVAAASLSLLSTPVTTIQPRYRCPPSFVCRHHLTTVATVVVPLVATTPATALATTTLAAALVVTALITVDCASALAALPPTLSPPPLALLDRQRATPLASSPSPAPAPPALSLQPPSPRSRHRSRSPTALSPSSHLRQRAAPSWPRHRPHAPYPPPSARRRGVLLAARRDHAVQRTSLGCADTPRPTDSGLLFAGASVPLSASSVHTRRAGEPVAHAKQILSASEKILSWSLQPPLGFTELRGARIPSEPTHR
jgi:hypothetical protein